MGRTNVGRGGRSGRGGGRGLSDHEAARGWGQISIQTNTSGTRFETNATIPSSDTGIQKSTRYETNATIFSGPRVQKSIHTNTSSIRSETDATIITSHTGVHKSIHTNTSGTHYETNATMSSDTRVQKSIRTNTSGTRSETNTGVQKSMGTNNTGTHSKKNATMSSDTRAQEPVGEDEPNTDVSQRRRGSNIVEQVPQDPSKRTLISIDGGEFTDPKVIRKITSILKTMFNGSWTTWKEVDKSGRDELWAHFKWEGLSDVLVHDAWENSMKKRFSDIMSKARNESVKLAQAAGVQFEGANCTILKPYNPEWIKSKHWEDMIDRVWKTPKWLNKAVSGSKNRNTVKEGSVSKHCAGSITISQHKRKFEQVHKRPPTAAELFELTHMKNGAFITSKSERVAVAYNVAVVDKYGPDPSNHPIYDDDLWKMCAGDDMKGGVFGWGSMSDPQYTLTGTPSTSRCTGASSSGSKDVQNYLDSVRGELKDELKEEVKVDLKEEMKASLKEEMKNEIKEEMRDELKEEMREELKEEMRAEIQDMLVEYGIKSRVTRQTKTKQGNASSPTI